MTILPPQQKASIRAASGADQPEADGFTIGQLSQTFSLTVRALRFYEQLGLLSPQRRGTARRYSRSDHDRILLILEGKKLGFTLREIRQLMAVPDMQGDRVALKLSRAQCVDQINHLERQKAAIEEALVELRRTYSSIYLRRLTKEGLEEGSGENAA